MKIKQVCEQTGLTDRAIRYYIEEGLVSPAFTENYMGRRAYDFADRDVAALNHVATLRKFGFTVEEIRRILADPQESVAIVAEVRARKEETVRQESDNLDALARLDGARAYTVAELAEALNEPVREVGVPKEDRWLNWRERLIAWLKATPVWVMGCAPLIVSVIVHGMLLVEFRFPAFDSSGLALYGTLMLISLAPSLVWLVCWWLWFRRSDRGCLKWFLAAVCVAWVPVALILQAMIAIASPVYSCTDNPAHYLQLNGWNAGDRQMIYDLFPAQPRTVMQVRGENGYKAEPVEVRYFYRDAYCVDPVFEVYAEWTLTPAELEAERLRLEKLFSAQERWTMETQQHGAFTCMLCYDGDAPFAGEVDYYTHAIFAFDEATGRVRYIYNEGVDANGYSDTFQPRYLLLDW